MRPDDRPLVFDLRLRGPVAERQDLVVPAPTFGYWEARELPEILESGPCFVFELVDGRFGGLVRATKLNLRDGWAYVSLRRVLPVANTTASLEAVSAFVDFMFGQFNLRKLYTESISSVGDLASEWRRAGFTEELRLVNRVWHGGESRDLMYGALARDYWTGTMVQRVKDSLALSAAITSRHD